MFATLLGALPRPPEGEDLEAQIRTVIEAQEAAGLEPLTDGRLRDPRFEKQAARLRAGAGAAGSTTSDVEMSSVKAWRFAASLTTRAVKQALSGPYSVGRAAARSGLDARALSLAAAQALRAEVEALAAAGCPLVEIEETAAGLVTADQAEQELFVDAHRRLTEGIAGTHLSLSIVGGAAWEATLAVMAAAPYASVALDVIDGPDSWNVVTRLAPERGVIVGALPARESPADAKELLLWATRYAAVSGGRGLARVGLGTAGSFANLAWESAVTKMDRLGEAARIASLEPGEELARSVDPRSISPRRAALGHAAGPRRSTLRRQSRGGSEEAR